MKMSSSVSAKAPKPTSRITTALKPVVKARARMTSMVHSLSHRYLPFEILLEPLIACMLASFLVANRSRFRGEFREVLHDVGPPIYVAFFTLAGASLELDVLARVWPVALILFGVRLVGIVIGSTAGGLAVGDPPSYLRRSWMAYVTQAGVGLGLALSRRLARSMGGDLSIDTAVTDGACFLLRLPIA